MYRTGPPAALVCLALALASCGGGGASSDAGTTAGGGTITSGAAPTRTQPPASPKPTKVAVKKGGGCQARLGDFVDRMDDLRQSLLAGLSYAEYVVRVRAIGDAYDAVPVDKLGVGCLAGSAAKAEDAFNQYLRAANTWGECAGTAGCAAGEIEGKLQRRWRIASRSLDAAG